MTRYWQCSKDKVLKTTVDAPLIGEITCCDRRMREFKNNSHTTAQAKYDHEVLQRDHIENEGPIPSGTQLMTDLNL